MLFLYTTEICTQYSFAILQHIGFFHHDHRSMTLGGLLCQPDRVVIGAFACLDCCCAGCVDGCSGPAAGFLLSSSGMGLLVGDALVVAGLGTSRMWTPFRLSCCPWGVVSRYDLGSSHFSRTVASSTPQSDGPASVQAVHWQSVVGL